MTFLDQWAYFLPKLFYCEILLCIAKKNTSMINHTWPKPNSNATTNLKLQHPPLPPQQSPRHLNFCRLVCSNSCSPVWNCVQVPHPSARFHHQYFIKAKSVTMTLNKYYTIDRLYYRYFYIVYYTIYKLFKDTKAITW